MNEPVKCCLTCKHNTLFVTCDCKEGKLFLLDPKPPCPYWEKVEHDKEV